MWRIDVEKVFEVWSGYCSKSLEGSYMEITEEIGNECIMASAVE